MKLIPYIKKTHNCIINIYVNTIPYREKNSIIQMFHIMVGCGRNQAWVRSLKPVNPSPQIMRYGMRHVFNPHS